MDLFFPFWWLVAALVLVVVMFIDRVLIKKKY